MFLWEVEENSKFGHILQFQGKKGDPQDADRHDSFWVEKWGVRLPWALSVSSLQTSRVPCRLYGRNAAALRIRVNTEDCIIKTIFLLKTFTKMKCLAPVGLRRDLASFKHHNYRTMKTESFMYICISGACTQISFLGWPLKMHTLDSEIIFCKTSPSI